MAIPLRTITFRPQDVIGQALTQNSRARVRVISNLPDDSVVVDKSSSDIRLNASAAATIEEDGGLVTISGLIDGAATSAQIDPTGVQYQILVDYVDPGVGEKTWPSGWLSITADGPLRVALGGQYIPPAYATSLVAQINASVVQAQTAAAAAQAAAEAAQNVAMIDLTSYAKSSDVNAAIASARTRSNHVGNWPGTNTAVFQDAVRAVQTPPGSVDLSAYSTTSQVNTALAGKANTNHTQAADTVTETTSRVFFTPTERTKLGGVATGATANRTDAATDALLAGKANTTHTQGADTVTETTARVFMAPAERTKLSGIATGATANRPDSAVDTLLTAKANVANAVFTGNQPTWNGQPLGGGAASYRFTSTANVTVANTTYISVPSFVFPIGANEEWFATWFLAYAADNTEGVRFDFTGPTGASVTYGQQGAPGENAASGGFTGDLTGGTFSGSVIRHSHAAWSKEMKFGAGSVNIRSHVEISLHVVNGSTAGSVQLRFSKAKVPTTATGLNAFLLPGSYFSAVAA